MLKTNPKDAIEDMAKALKGVFKTYSYSSRKSAWENLIKGKGKAEVEKLLVHPDKQVNQFKKLSFREWLNSSPGSNP
jgi:hypothetical protein